MTDQKKDVPVANQKWYFSFGFDHRPGVNRFMVFTGTYDECRDQMVIYFSTKWAFQYSRNNFLPQIKNYGLEEFNIKKERIKMNNLLRARVKRC